MRINPCYKFSLWQWHAGEGAHLKFFNESNQQQCEVDVHVHIQGDHGVTLSYDRGVKVRTHFAVQPGAQGASLVVLDEYAPLTATEEKQALLAVDKSLNAWGEALRLFFVRQRRYHYLPGWRWYIRRVWIPMQPAARRIIWYIWLISIFEFFFFLFVLTIYIIER